MAFKIVAGDFPKQAIYISTFGEASLSYFDPVKSRWKPQIVLLKGQVAKVEQVTEDNKKKILGSVGWGTAGMVVGGLIAAPIALIAGLAGILAGGNKKEVCFVCHLKDGRKFMAVSDQKIYQNFLVLSF